jgi:hypothetical protein
MVAILGQIPSKNSRAEVISQGSTNVGREATPADTPASTTARD